MLFLTPSYYNKFRCSDENRELFYDYTYEKTCLSTRAIKALASEL